MAKAIVGVYVSSDTYSDTEVISTEEYEEKVKARAEEFFQDEYEFREWLEENYTFMDLWAMTDSQKESVKNRFSLLCKDWAEDEIGENWYYYEIETEISCSCEN